MGSWSARAGSTRPPLQAFGLLEAGRDPRCARRAPGASLRARTHGRRLPHPAPLNPYKEKTEMADNNYKRLDCYPVTQGNEREFWTRIGAAFVNRGGSKWSSMNRGSRVASEQRFQGLLIGLVVGGPIRCKLINVLKCLFDELCLVRERFVQELL